MKFYLQSWSDVITNSSTEIYQEATEYTVSAVKEIINTILKIAGSDKTCDDLFIVAIDYEDMLERYFDSYIPDIEDDELREKADKIVSDNIHDSLKDLYQKLVDADLIGEDKLMSISKYTDTWDDWDCYASTSVSIIPKKECDPRDVRILDKINDLFSLNASFG